MISSHKIIKWAGCLIITMAMLASAASACACDHHAAAADPLSCHGSSAKQPAGHHPSSADVRAANSAGIDCSCRANIQLPSAQAKADPKRSKAAKKLLAAFLDVPSPYVNAAVAAGHDDRPHISNFYSITNAFSGPSRAPPRL